MRKLRETQPELLLEHQPTSDLDGASSVSAEIGRVIIPSSCENLEVSSRKEMETLARRTGMDYRELIDLNESQAEEARQRLSQSV